MLRLCDWTAADLKHARAARGARKKDPAMPRSDAAQALPPPRQVSYLTYCPMAPPRGLVTSTLHDWTPALQLAWTRHRGAPTREFIADTKVPWNKIPEDSDRYGGSVWRHWLFDGVDIGKAAIQQANKIVVYRCPVCRSFLRRVEV